MVGRNMSLKNPVTPPGIDAGTIRIVVQSLNHYATPGPQQYTDHRTHKMESKTYKTINKK
jgi:hypothetical protein